MTRRGLDVLALSVALTATLIATFVISNFAAFLFPSMHFPRCWVCLFTDAVPGSHKSMTDGILASGLLGLGFSALLGATYTCLERGPRGG